MRRNKQQHGASKDNKVPVKMLYVSGIESTVSESDLIKYFSTQGQVANFVLHDEEDHKYAFVKFATYEDATKVLKNKQHCIKACRLQVLPADTWHQPKPEFVYDENAPSLMMLNDDCLLYLLDYFNVLEIIKLRGVCTRLDNLIDIYCKKFFNFDFYSLSDPTLMNARDILKFLGPNMKSLKIAGSNLNSNSIKWIARYCKNLEKLELYNFNLNELKIKELKPVIQHLKSFSIWNNRNMGDDEFGIFFQDTTQLEELTISGNWKITGKCLTKLSNLKTLSVNCCRILQSKPFKEALKKNKTLKKLDIRHCSKLDNSVVNCIVSDVQGIEELSLSNVYTSMSNYSHFADLPHLKKLTVQYHSFTAIDALLEKLSEKNILEELLYIGPCSHPVKEAIKHISKITNLRTFSMPFYYCWTDDNLKMLQNLTQLTSFSIPGAKKVSANGLLALLSACKEIKYLDVSQIEVEIEFLEKVIHMWKQSVNRPKLELILFQTKIDKYSKDVQKLLNENRFHVKTSFASTLPPNY